MSTQFTERYRERNVARPREMLALRGTSVDLTKWQRVSPSRKSPGVLRRIANALIELIAHPYSGR